MDAGSVETLKLEANALFKDGKYAEAIKTYSEALALDANNATILSNRSAAYLKSGNAEQALFDAQQCTKLRPNWEKSHFRQGAALEELGELQQALTAYEVALSFDQNSKELISKVRTLKRKVKDDDSSKAQAASTTSSSLGQASALDPSNPSPSAWARGLTPDKQAEWFVDCYRMRVDDDMAWGGGNLHGLYDMEGDKDTIINDFLIFCKLAVRNKVLPAGWSWNRCLDHAAKLLPYAFEKEDAKEKWGGENIFAGVMGGRSLRFTGEMVYGFSCMGSADYEGNSSKAYRSVEEKVESYGGWHGLVSSGSEVFKDVGGVDLWKQLHSRLVVPRPIF